MLHDLLVRVPHVVHGLAAHDHPLRRAGDASGAHEAGHCDEGLDVAGRGAVGAAAAAEVVHEGLHGEPKPLGAEDPTQAWGNVLLALEPPEQPQRVGAGVIDGFHTPRQFVSHSYNTPTETCFRKPMDTASATELDSLRRQGKSFNAQIIAHDQQHRITIARLNETIFKKRRSHDRTCKELNSLKVERNGLKRTVNVWESKFKAKELECVQLQREVRKLCHDCDAFAKRLKELENATARQTTGAAPSNAQGTVDV